jgi:hypothetical protein
MALALRENARIFAETTATNDERWDELKKTHDERWNELKKASRFNEENISSLQRMISKLGEEYRDEFEKTRESLAAQAKTLDRHDEQLRRLQEKTEIGRPEPAQTMPDKTTFDQSCRPEHLKMRGRLNDIDQELASIRLRVNAVADGPDKIRELTQRVDAIESQQDLREAALYKTVIHHVQDSLDMPRTALPGGEIPSLSAARRLHADNARAARDADKRRLEESATRKGPFNTDDLFGDKGQPGGIPPESRIPVGRRVIDLTEDSASEISTDKPGPITFEETVRSVDEALETSRSRRMSGFQRVSAPRIPPPITYRPGSLIKRTTEPPAIPAYIGSTAADDEITDQTIAFTEPLKPNTALSYLQTHDDGHLEEHTVAEDAFITRFPRKDDPERLRGETPAETPTDERAEDDPILWRAPDDRSKVDPWGLEPEFEDLRPILPKLSTTRAPDDLNWDISPELTIDQQRQIMKILGKHLRTFSGPDKRIGHTPNEYDMDIEADEAKHLHTFSGPEKRMDLHPILPKAPEAERNQDDLDWDVSPELTIEQQRQIMQILRKHLPTFSGLEKRIGRAPKEYDMDIDADEAKLWVQQP